MTSQSHSQKTRLAWATLVNKLTTCNTESERIALISEMLSGSEAQVVSFLNAHACNIAADNAEFHSSLSNSNYLLRDGVGVELHMFLRGTKPGINLNGTELIPEIIRATKGQVALYGTKIEHVTSAREVLGREGIAVDIMDGFRPDDDYIQQALANRPRLIVLGMGMPKQEILSVKLRAALGAMPVLIVNGGAIIDFIAGIYPRAPDWIRRIRLESLYRLLLEPRRLWRRNVGSLIFLKRSVTTVLSDRKSTVTK